MGTHRHSWSPENFQHAVGQPESKMEHTSALESWGKLAAKSLHAPASEADSSPRQRCRTSQLATVRRNGVSGRINRRLPAEERGRRLIQAAVQGLVGELRALLAAGTDVEARGGWGWTALHWAAVRGDVEVARLLVEAGADVNARESSREQMMPLHLAAERGGAAVARLLLQANADPNVRDSDGWTPLHWAAYSGQAEVAAALLEAGADTGAAAGNGQTVLDIARQNDDRRLMEMLS
ncbi:ankyrin repeat domain-containing protein 65-like [Schistocerca piceifrons]|uniref:ankyrin repeat domain-containing protein 65-like n=1 Tax=Schistocerca piceifrons TaxID=274613 RepID=UPI001F5F1DCB|nr:ankyrin repeat domain-containing protein 65-like [Schistocerca piceifrons]